MFQSFGEFGGFPGNDNQVRDDLRDQQKERDNVVIVTRYDANERKRENVCHPVHEPEIRLRRLFGDDLFVRVFHGVTLVGC